MPPFAKSNGGTLTAAQIQVLVHEIKGVPYRTVEKNAEGKTQTEVVAAKDGVAPAWGPVGPALPWDPPYLAPDGLGSEARGRLLFAKACASCHGADGAGVLQDEKPRRQINDPAFLSLISDQALRRIMITGRPDLKMPNYLLSNGRPKDFEPLTSQDIADLGALLAAWRHGKSAR